MGDFYVDKEYRDGELDVDIMHNIYNLHENIIIKQSQKFNYIN